MNEQIIGTIGNYDVALLAGNNVMRDSGRLKGDNVHNSFESHSKVFQKSHFFLVIVEHDLLQYLRNLSSKRNGNNMYDIFSYKYRVYFRSPEVRSDPLLRRNENRTIKTKYQSISQCMRIFQRLCKWNQLHSGLG